MEPGFVAGVRIILLNSLGCELNAEFVPEGQDIKAALIAMIKDGEPQAGDTYMIVETESEIG